MSNGYWAKKIQGHWRYFGKWDDPAAALEKYQNEVRSMISSDVPGSTAVALVRDMLKIFLHAKEQKVESGEMERETYYQYRHVCDAIAEVFTTTRPLASLSPSDFQLLRSYLAEKYSKVRLANMIQYVRCICKYTYEFGLIDKPMRFGPELKSPPRRSSAKPENARTPRMFPPKILRKLIRRSDPELKAMILLGINAGFGCKDCATLPLRALDLDHGWIRYARPKTGIQRRCPLWPETTKALKAYLAQRPEPQKPEDARLVFLVGAGPKIAHPKGETTWRVTPGRIARHIRRLLDELKIAQRRTDLPGPAPHLCHRGRQGWGSGRREDHHGARRE